MEYIILQHADLQLIRLSFQPLIFSQPAVFFSHINQPTVLLAAYFQPSEQAVD
jgi:hypothetical protein